MKREIKPAGYGEMTVREAGIRGGRAVKEKYGPAHFKKMREAKTLPNDRLPASLDTSTEK